MLLYDEEFTTSTQLVTFQYVLKYVATEYVHLSIKPSENDIVVSFVDNGAWSDIDTLPNQKKVEHDKI